MKIKYIKEGYFKNPEKVKKSRENKKDGGELVASLSKNIIYNEAYKIFNTYVEIGKKSYEDYFHFDMHDELNMKCHILYREFKGAVEAIFSTFANKNFPTQYEVIPSFKNEGLTLNVNVTLSKKDNYSENDSSVYFTVRPWKFFSYGNAGMMKERLSEYFRNCVVADYDKKRSSSNKYLYDMILKSNIEFEKFHLFADISGDCYLDLNSKDFKAETKSLTGVAYMAKAIAKMFSFENKGKVIYRCLPGGNFIYDTDMSTYSFPDLNKDTNNLLLKIFEDLVETSAENYRTNLVTAKGNEKYNKYYIPLVKKLDTLIKENPIILNCIRVDVRETTSMIDFEIDGETVKQVPRIRNIVALRINYSDSRHTSPLLDLRKGDKTGTYYNSTINTFYIYDLFAYLDEHIEAISNKTTYHSPPGDIARTYIPEHYVSINKDNSLYNDIQELLKLLGEGNPIGLRKIKI